MTKLLTPMYGLGALTDMSKRKSFTGGTGMTACYLCGSTSNWQRPGQVRDNPTLKVLECSKCGLVFLSSFDHIHPQHYDDSGMHGDRPLPVDEWLREAEWDDERRFEFVRSSLTGKRVLDFGCGAGGFLLKARTHAACVNGVEPESRLQAHFQQEQLTVFSNLEELLGQAPDLKFDLITAFHVMEHLSDPRSILKQLPDLLAEGGQLIVEVPSSDDVLLTLYECDPFMHFTYWSQHLFLFNSSTLSTLVDQSDLKLQWIKQVQRHPLSNHLHWLARGKPGGHDYWSFMDSPLLKEAYSAQLAALGRCDTILAGISRD
jgi:2-polyprenyl-3-methyl-5-hydroxy-6-metoxy-1,4-benzoquinol methylase